MDALEYAARRVNDIATAIGESDNPEQEEQFEKALAALGRVRELKEAHDQRFPVEESTIVCSYCSSQNTTSASWCGSCGSVLE